MKLTSKTVIVSVVFISTVQSLAFSQSLYFKYLGRNATSEDMVSSYMGNISLNKDGGHTIIASTTFGNGSEDIYVTRLDKNGTKMWSKAIGTANYEYGSGIAQTSDSGFIVVGTYNMVLGNASIIVTKLSKNGSHVWSRQIGTGALPCNGWDVVIENGTQNIYVLGTTYNDPTAYWNYDATLTKFDANGNMLWSKFIGSNGYELVYAMTILRNGNIAVTGSGVLFCSDTSGNVLWSRTLSQNDSWDIQPTADSGCVVSGRFTFYSPSSDEEFILEKIDKNGSLVWFKRIGDLANSSTSQQGVSCYISNDANIFMIGWGYGSPNGSGDLYGILIKTTPTGNLIWSKAIDIAGATTVACKVAASGINDGINISGYTLSPNPNYWNLFNANLDSAGNTGCIVNSFPMSIHSSSGSISAAALTSKTGYTSVAIVPTLMNVVSDTINVCSTPVPMPIELLSFSASLLNKKVLLNWETATEINNAYFTIQKSKDAINFESLVEIPGAGNSNNLLRYSYTDNQPYNGISYYRLIQTDFNGDDYFSNMVVVKNISDNHFSISSNPFTDHFSLSLNSNYFNDKGGVPLTIYDISGRVVFNEVDTKTEFTIQTSGWDNGIYFIQVGYERLKIVKI